MKPFNLKKRVARMPVNEISEPQGEEEPVSDEELKAMLLEEVQNDPKFKRIYNTWREQVYGQFPYLSPAAQFYLWNEIKNVANRWGSDAEMQKLLDRTKDFVRSKKKKDSIGE